MYSVRFISNKRRIVLATPSSRLANLFRNSRYVRHLLPDFRMNQGDDNKDEFRIEIVEGDGSYEEGDNSILVSTRTEGLDEGQLSFLALHGVKKASIAGNQHIVHGAAIARNGRSLLLLGPSKSGKSNLSLELALGEGFKIYGDDSVVLDSSTEMLMVNGGNKYVGGRRFLSDKRVKESLQGEYIDLEQVSLSQASPLRLADVFFLEHDHFNTNPSREISDQRGKLLLYEHISREDRSAGFCLFDSRVPLPPVDSYSTSRNLLEVISSSDVHFYVLTGGYENMLDSLLRFSQERE